MQEPTRLVRIITRLNIGGPAIQATNLSSRLETRGYRTLLIHGRLARGEGDMSYMLPEGGPARVYVPPLCRQVAPARDAAACVAIFRHLCRFRPALVHTHTAKAGTVGRIATLLYNRTAGRRAPARILHTYHGHVFEGYFSARTTALFVAIERALARQTDTIVAISPQVRHDLLDHRIGHEAQCRVIPLGFDLHPFAAITETARGRARQDLGIAPDARVVTSVGRLTAIKEPGLFVEMADLVSREIPGTVFLMAGDGELRTQVEQQVRARRLGDRLRLLGWQRDLARIYAATDVFVLTSRNEGTPVALIEAMASGVPGVSTDVGGVRDVLSDDCLGVRVPFGSAPMLASSVVSLLQSPERRRAMGAQGRESVLGRYSLERLLTDITTLYEQLLAARRA